MYQYQHSLCEKEALYIAGPECFYRYGYQQLLAMRRKAEALGFQVTLPNDNPLDMDDPDLQKRADSIFADLEKDMNQTTAIIADLEAYRGAEADSGTIYEIGMAYAKNARCYGYTRDKRSLYEKDYQLRLKAGSCYDERGRLVPYGELPFSPCIIGSTKIIEGDFDDCLRLMITDLEEERKQGLERKYCSQAPRIGEKRNRPLVYLAGSQRYEKNAREIFQARRELCVKHGLDVLSPLEPLPDERKKENEHPYEWAARVFRRYQTYVRSCDAVIADLNDYRGYEISNDVGFECGMGFQLGKRLIGYMKDASPLVERIPHKGEREGFRDQTGSNVENFNYPANLMFGCSMKILEGEFEEIIEKAAKELKK